MRQALKDALRTYQYALDNARSPVEIRRAEKLWSLAQDADRQAELREAVTLPLDEVWSLLVESGEYAHDELTVA